MAPLKLLAIYKRTVGTTHINELPAASLANDLGMFFRNVVFWKMKIIRRNAPNADLVLIKSDFLTTPVLLLDNYPQHPSSLPPQRCQFHPSKNPLTHVVSALRLVFFGIAEP